MESIIGCLSLFFVQITLTSPFYIEDPYLILNLRRSASMQDIQTSFRTLALLIHPDKNWCDNEASEKFHILRNAYLLIKTSATRTQFDAKHPQAGLYTTPWNWNLPHCPDRKKGDSSSSSKNEKQKTEKGTSRKRYHKNIDYLAEAHLELKELVQLFQKWYLLTELTLGLFAKRCVILYWMILLIKPIFSFLHNVTWTKSTQTVMLCSTFIWNYQNIGNIITKEPDTWLVCQYVLCFAASETISDIVYDDIKKLNRIQFWFFILLRLYHYAFFIYIYYYFTVYSYAEKMSKFLFWSFELLTQPVLFIIYGYLYIMLYASYYAVACILYFPVTLCRYFIQLFRYE